MLNIVNGVIENFFRRIRCTFHSEKEKTNCVYCMRIANTRTTLIVRKPLNNVLRYVPWYVNPCLKNNRHVRANGWEKYRIKKPNKDFINVFFFNFLPNLNRTAVCEKNNPYWLCLLLHKNTFSHSVSLLGFPRRSAKERRQIVLSFLSEFSTLFVDPLNRYSTFIIIIINYHGPMTIKLLLHLTVRIIRT